MAGIAGCGGPKETSVSGTVKYQGKPLITGYVLFQFDDGNSVNASLGTDGSYTMHTQFQGHAKIAVGSPKPPDQSGVGNRRGADPSTAPDPKNWVPIPEKYQNADTSGLEITVTSGTNKHDIELQ
jgi:hypothetical protein